MQIDVTFPGGKAVAAQVGRHLVHTDQPERDKEKKLIHTVRVDLELPAEFPDKYVRAIERSMDQCAVKRHMFEPPKFEIDTRICEP